MGDSKTGRRQVLECMVWAGAGVLWTVQGGIPRSSLIGSVVGQGASLEAALSGVQERALLDRALAAIPEELRECLVLRELEEMSYKDSAQITGAPIGTVMSRLWRARRALLEAAR